MDLTQRARSEALRFSSAAGEWGTSVLFEAPTGETVTIGCRVNEHHLAISAEGTPVNSKQSSVCFSVLAFDGIAYPLRNAEGDIHLEDHKVSWDDITNTRRTYMVRDWFPDNTLGYVACTLTDFE